MDDSANQIKSESVVRQARKAIRKKMFGYIAAGLGLVAGLAWNDAIKSVIDYFLPDNASSIWAKLIYAVLITAVVSVLLFYVEKRLDDGNK